MNYISPFIVFKITPANVNGDQLKLIRRKFLAEFELSGNPPAIEMDGISIEKNKGLQLIEELQNPQTLEFHSAIFEDGALLNFLSENKIPTHDSFSNNTIYSNINFLSFISEYFLETYQEVIGNAFKERDVYILGRTCKLPMLAEAENKKMLFRKIRGELNGLIDEMREIYPLGKRANKLNLHKYSDQVLIDCIGFLPEEAIDIKDTYANELIVFAKHSIIKLNNKDAAKDILKKISSMDINQSVKEKAKREFTNIVLNRGAYRSKLDLLAQKRGAIPIFVLGITLLVVVVFVFIFSQMPNENNSTDAPDFSSVSDSSTTVAGTQIFKDVSSKTNLLYELYNLPTWQKESRKYNAAHPPTAPTLSGYHPYAQLLETFLDTTNPKIFRPIKIYNETNEDVILIIQNNFDSIVTSIFIRENEHFDSAFSVHPVSGLTIYCLGGTSWNPDVPIISTTISNPNINPITVDIHGAFIHPDTLNMKLLKYPLWDVRIPPILSTEKTGDYNLYLYKDEKGKIRARFKKLL